MPWRCDFSWSRGVAVLLCSLLRDGRSCRSSVTGLRFLEFCSTWRADPRTGGYALSTFIVAHPDGLVEQLRLTVQRRRLPHCEIQYTSSGTPVQFSPRSLASNPSYANARTGRTVCLAQPKAHWSLRPCLPLARKSGHASCLRALLHQGSVLDLLPKLSCLLGWGGEWRVHRASSGGPAYWQQCPSAFLGALLYSVRRCGCLGPSRVMAFLCSQAEPALQVVSPQEGVSPHQVGHILSSAPNTPIEVSLDTSD